MAEVSGSGSLIRGWLYSLASIIFPRRCACCSSPLDDTDSELCLTCRYDMPLTGYYFRKDNYVVELFAGRVDFRTASALMYFRYGSDYQTMIHRMKYSGRDDIARMLGVIYGGYLSRSPFYSDIDIVVPVPLHFTKKIKRGYNQSYEFARGVASAMGVKCIPDVLRRHKRTRTQARLTDREHRADNVKGAFRVLHAKRYSGKKILLVDDVITTGATLEACARALNSQVPDAVLYLGAIAVVARKK